MTNLSTALLLVFAPLYVFCAALGGSCLVIGSELIRLALDYKSNYSEKTFERFKRVAIGGGAISTVVSACVAASYAWFCFIEQNFLMF